MTLPRWEHFPHEADVGVRGIGATRDAAFEQAALAMTAAITDLSAVAPRTQIEVTCQDADQELLFADWLNALVYEMATRHMLFSRFKVHIDGPRLSAIAEGEPIDLARHHPAVEVKGATFTQLKVAPQPDGSWIAQCVVDV